MAPMTIGRLGVAVVACACWVSTGDAFFTGGALPSSGLTADRASVSRDNRTGLYMAKHRQNKGTKKHVKNRPKKTRLSDKNRTPTVHPIECDTINWPGKPPVYEIFEEAEPGIDTKASVIESIAAAEYDKRRAELVASGERPEVDPPMPIPDKAGIAAMMKEKMYKDDRRHELHPKNQKSAVAEPEKQPA